MKISTVCGTSDMKQRQIKHARNEEEKSQTYLKRIFKKEFPKNKQSGTTIRLKNMYKFKCANGKYVY